jgi:hypothetical protein
VKLIIEARASFGDEVFSRNSLSSPDVPEPTGSGPLAVVGGGASIINHIDELREWPGEIWAINGTADYLRENGIECWFYSVDPDPDLAGMVSGKAVLAKHCDPKCFQNADVAYKTTGPFAGPTSAVAATSLGLKAGFTPITFFGCESNYGEQTHAYRDEVLPNLVELDCGGEIFLTKLELILQAEQLAGVINRFPEHFSERSGGFLRAMIEHGGYAVKRVSPNIMKGITT